MLYFSNEIKLFKTGLLKLHWYYVLCKGFAEERGQNQNPLFRGGLPFIKEVGLYTEFLVMKTSANLSLCALISLGYES